MKNAVKKIGIGILVSLAILAGAIWIYASDYYHASEEAVSIAREATREVMNDYLIYEPAVIQGQNSTNAMATKNIGIILYPGGKVQYEAYAPLAKALAEQGFTCILVHMPLNLAVLDIDKATKMQALYPEIEDWYLLGHSLGGAMGASYVGKHKENYSGLILLGAYATNDLQNSGIKVLSIYGSEDGVLNREKYEEYSGNLPPDVMEVVIEGGCHAYFGDYGAQKGDGMPKITGEQQLEQTVENILQWVVEQTK